MFGDKQLEFRTDRLAKLEKEMVGRVIEDGTTAEIIEVYQQILEAEKIKNDYYVLPTSSNWFSSMLSFVISTIALATIISFVAYIPCGQSKSIVCTNARIIPNQIFSAFKEP